MKKPILVFIISMTSIPILSADYRGLEAGKIIMEGEVFIGPFWDESSRKLDFKVWVECKNALYACAGDMNGSKTDLICIDGKDDE